MTVKGPWAGLVSLEMEAAVCPFMVLVLYHKLSLTTTVTGIISPPRLQRARRAPRRPNSHYPTSPGPSNHAAPHFSPAPALVCF